MLKNKRASSSLVRIQAFQAWNASSNLAARIMDEFEYIIYSIYTKYPYDDSTDAKVKLLNEFGKEGWEVVNWNENDSKFLLKRKRRKSVGFKE